MMTWEKVRRLRDVIESIPRPAGTRLAVVVNAGENCDDIPVMLYHPCGHTIDISINDDMLGKVCLSRLIPALYLWMECRAGDPTAKCFRLADDGQFEPADDFFAASRN